MKLLVGYKKNKLSLDTKNLKKFETIWKNKVRAASFSFQPNYELILGWILNWPRRDNIVSISID